MYIGITYLAQWSVQELTNGRGEPEDIQLAPPRSHNVIWGIRGHPHMKISKKIRLQIIHFVISVSSKRVAGQEWQCVSNVKCLPGGMFPRELK